MWKTEFKRLFFNKKTVIILLILIILGIISFYISYKDRLNYIETYYHNYIDIDNLKLERLINNYNGVQFNLNFFLTSDFIQIYIIVLILFVGIFLSSDIQSLIETGQENYILCRTSYRNHVKNIFIAQSSYIATIVSISFIIISTLGFIIGGYGSGITSIGFYDINIFWSILIIFIQLIEIIVFIILINGICLFSNNYIKNKIIIQSSPFVVFLIAPMIISSTIGNLIPVIGNITSSFVPFNILMAIYWVLQYEFDLFFIVSSFIPYVIYSFLLMIMYKKNISVFSKDCI